MALIRCPECGKEISDRAKSCPNCGFPVEEKVQEFAQYNDDRVEELPPDERPEMFECYQCNRKIPVGSEECIFCGRVYGVRSSSESEVQCPSCGSFKVKQISNKPFLKNSLKLLQ